jgi:hypothetical protein
VVSGYSVSLAGTGMLLVFGAAAEAAGITAERSLTP